MSLPLTSGRLRGLLTAHLNLRMQDKAPLAEILETQRYLDMAEAGKSLEEILTDELPLEYLAAIGAISLNFAALETSLDFTVAAIFNGIDKMGDDDIARSLDKKLGFLRRAFKDDRLASVRVAGNALLDEVHNVKEDRHDVIHGALVGEGLEILRVRYTPTRHVTKTKAAPSQKELEALALKISGLFENALSVAIDTFNIAQPKNRVDNPFGQ